MSIIYVRALRTSSSERFLLHRDGADIGALDCHYLEGGRVHATLTLFEEHEPKESDIEAILTEIDRVLFPDASLKDRKLVFTVVVGRAVGSFESDRDE